MLFNLFQPIMLCWVHIFDITPNHLPFRGGLLERERERGNNRIRAQHFFSTQHKTRHVVRFVENPSHTTSCKSIWGLYNRFRCQLNSQKYPPDHRTHSLGFHVGWMRGTLVGPKWDDPKPLDDGGEIPKSQGRGGWFESWPWNLLITWQK